MGKLWTNEETMPFVTAWREAELLRVVDGDTFDVRVDLGFDVMIAARVRLMSEELVTGLGKSNVDTWEVRGEEREAGLRAKARAIELFSADVIAHPRVRIFSAKGGSRGKYGRWLACVLYKVNGGWRSIGNTLLEEGHAERPDY